MIDQLGRDPRVLQVLLDQPGVFLVDLLGGRFRRRFLRLKTRAEGEGGERGQREDAEFHPQIVIRNPRSEIRNPRWIRNPRSIRNPRGSAIRSPRSAIERWGESAIQRWVLAGCITAGHSVTKPSTGPALERPVVTCAVHSVGGRTPTGDDAARRGEDRKRNGEYADGIEP